MKSGQETFESAGRVHEDLRNEENKSKEDESHSSKSMKNWSKIREIVRNTNGTESNKHTSMTEQEQEFLKMRNTFKSFRKERIKFTDVVEAAVARERLRRELQARLSKLTSKEAEFLKEIVEDEDVTEAQLTNADRVLRSDPLYRLPDEAKDDTRSSRSVMFVEEVDTDEGIDVRIKVDHNGIEAIIKSSTSKSDREELSENIDIEKILSKPSTYSYQTWDLIKDEKQEYPILGVTDEIKESSRVLSPPMIDCLRTSLPFAVAEDNFWLKYNLSQDGASLDALYHSIRQSSKTIVAIETFSGEVFGAFLSSPWRTQRGFYGSCEAFVWKLKESRFTPTDSIEEQARVESNVEVFKWSQDNRNIQMSDHTKMAIGGGRPENNDEEEWGFGIALDDSLYKGTSSPCITFQSPILAPGSSQGQVFEVSNLEVWTLTPCQNETEAEQLELGRMFVLSHFAS